jgi:hypothetical protein
MCRILCHGDVCGTAVVPTIGINAANAFASVFLDGVVVVKAIMAVVKEVV